jgi:hypothetical protein
MLLWARFLTKFASTLDTIGDRPSVRASDARANWSMKSVRLGLRQVYLSGEIRVLQDDPRRLMIGDQLLTLAIPAPLVSGKLASGVGAEIVYQLVPGLPNLRLVMAVRLSGDGRAHGVAALVQSISAVIALGCLAWFGWLSPHPSEVWSILSGLLLLTSLLYIFMTFRAIRSLQEMQSTAPHD